MNKTRRNHQRHKPNVPVHPGHNRPKPEAGRFGLIPVSVPDMQYFVMPSIQPDFRCPGCKKTWVRETRTVALSSDGKRQVIGLTGYRCCSAKFAWGETNLSNN